jgi:peptidoglycan/xylan/chitin deacetylase (PgdA/CDA1 family)
MPGGRKAGMDHDIYPYSPIDRRPPFRLPGGARVAFFVLLHFEYRELTPRAGAYRDPRFRGEFGDFAPEYHTWTYREYGDRIGVFRLLSLFDALGLPVSVAINAAAAERRPNLVEAARSRGYEPVAHGLSATQMITSRMSVEEERRHILEARDRVARAWGAAPLGWLGQDYGVTSRTSRLLAEAGFSYTLDWPNDEQPYWHNPDRSLIAVPSQPDWDDVQTLLLRRTPVHHFPQLVRDALERLVAETDGGRVFGVGVHPWMIGAPHRIRYLKEVLEAAVGMPGVLPSTTGQIAQWFREGSSP